MTQEVMIASLKQSDRRKWQVIYSRPKSEGQVVSKLKEKGIEYFLPARNGIRQLHESKKKIEMPGFPGYCFVRANDKDSLKIYMINGFVRCVSTDSTFDIISEEEMSAIQQLFQEDYQISTETLCESDPVQITDGPLIGLEGVLEGNQESGHVLVSVEILNKRIKVLVSVTCLQRKEERLLAAG